MPGKSSLSVAAAAMLALLVSGCDTKKRIVAPQSDTPTDTGQAPTHVRLFSEPRGSPTAIHALRPTGDGGYVAVGYFNGAPWIFKTNAQGSIEWQQTVSAPGGPFGLNRFNDVQIASDGAYVAAGRLNDRAVVIKFRIDGSIAWQWSGTHGPLNPPNNEDRGSAEALAVAVKAGGTGFVIAGDVGRAITGDDLPLSGGNWSVELDFDGLQGQYVDPGLVGFDPGPPVFWPVGIYAIGDNVGDSRGRIKALEPWTERPTPSDVVKQGFWFAGQSAEGQMLVGRQQSEPVYRPSLLWKANLGPGTFHAMRLVNRELPDGGREPHLLLVGETPDAILVCELQARTGAVIWARRISSAESFHQTHWVANSILGTGDGGSVLAAATIHAPAVLKLARDGAIEWQYEYVPPGSGHGIERGQALSIQPRADGGYRVAGHQNMEKQLYGVQGLRYVEELATVFDIDSVGDIHVNEKSGWTKIATTATAETVALEPREPAGELHGFDAYLWHPEDVDTTASVSRTDVIIETASGLSGVLPVPAVVSNDAADTFAWGNSAGASGFIIFRSADGVTFARDNQTQDFDFDLRTSGFYRVAAFNGAGYSEYSPIIGPLGRGTPTTPGQRATLRVANSAGGGTVTSTPAGIGCGTDCAEDFAIGTDVVLSVTDGEPLHFSSWVGCNSTAGRQCTVHMDRDITVRVNYAEPN